MCEIHINVKSPKLKNYQSGQIAHLKNYAYRDKCGF